MFQRINVTSGAVGNVTTVAEGDGCVVVADAVVVDGAAAVVGGAGIAAVVIPPPAAAEGTTNCPSGGEALGAIGSRRKVETSVERSAHNLLVHHFWCGDSYGKGVTGSKRYGDLQVTVSGERDRSGEDG